jgi:hypothetical protein
MWPAIKHQIGKIYLAAFSGFITPYMTARMIDSYTGRTRYDISIYTAVVMLGCYLLSEIVEMWFAPAWDVRKWLQHNLARRYLSLSAHEMSTKAAYAEEKSRTAIETTATQLTTRCFSGFHSVLSSTWSIVASLAYLFHSSSTSKDTLRLAYYLGVPVTGLGSRPAIQLTT